MSFENDLWKDDQWAMPQRIGPDVGGAQEFAMQSVVGGYQGIRTVEFVNHNGSITTLRNRNGWPEFNTTEVQKEEEEDDIKGLVTNGIMEKVKYLPSGEDVIQASFNWPDDIDTDPDNAGEAYQVKNFTLNGKSRKQALVSGIRHWFCGEELGPLSWVYVPSTNAECWKVTLTAMADDLTSFTVQFERMPTTSKIPPSRIVTQTHTVSGVSPLQPEVDVYRWETAIAHIEDIAPNGGKVIIVNAHAPFMSDIQDLASTGPYLSNKQIAMQGRYVFGAVELCVTGVPPLAAVTLNTLYTGEQALGPGKIQTSTVTRDPLENFLIYSKFEQKWEDLLVGLRYSQQLISGSIVYVATPITQNVTFTDTVELNESTTQIVDYVFSFLYQLGDTRIVTIKFRETEYTYTTVFTVSQEGVEVEMRSLGVPVLHGFSYAPPYFWLDQYGNSYGGTDLAAYYGYVYPFPQPTWNYESSFGKATFPMKADGLSGGAHPGFLSTITGTQYSPIYTSPLSYSAFPKHPRPRWNTSLAVEHSVYSGDITVSDLLYPRGICGIIGVKYANRVFGLQAVSYGKPNPSPASYGGSRGPGIIYPACIGKQAHNSVFATYSTPAYALLPAISSQDTSVIIDMVGEHTDRWVGEEYPTKNNKHIVPSSGTARYVNAKAVVDQENVVFAHYF